MCRTSGVIKEGLLSSTDLSCRYAVIYSRSTPRLSKKDFHHRPPYSKEIPALKPTMHSTRGWWVLVACLLVAYHAAGLSLNDLKYHRSTDHVGRHHHGTQTAEDTLSESTTNEPDVEDVKNIENACCRRQEKFVSIGFGVSGEVVQLDVGHCQKKRCLSLLSLMDPDVADFDSSVFKPCPRESSCLPFRSRIQRVSTLSGIQELSVVEECVCRHKSGRCYRQPHTLQLYPGTPYETHLDVGICSGGCDSESGCRPVRNKTVSIPGPNGVQCHSVTEECSCAGDCYRMSSLETVYDYTDVPDNGTGSAPAIKEVDVGQCTGSCSSGQTRKCLLRDQTDPSKCLTGLYAKQSSCTPSHFKVHRYTTKDRQTKEIISVTHCKCM